MLTFVRGHTFTEALVGLKLLRGLDTYYPEFEYWYTNSVMPGIVVGKDILLLAKENERVVGLALGKRNAHETKLRCVRVQESHQGSGLGVKLIDRMLEQLDSEMPHCTVAEELFHDYSRVFVKRYGFHLSDVTKGEYRRNRLEYHWN
jgi:GNAT superfamily N-acetyltransferase